MISRLQSQVSNARHVLSSAESKAVMSQAELAKSLSELASIRSSIEGESIELHDASKKLHTIEAEILDKQPRESELKQSMDEVEQAKQDLHRDLHLVLVLPEHSDPTAVNLGSSDYAKLTKDQHQQLDSNADYQSTSKALETAGLKLKGIRTKLFAANANWTSAQQELAAVQHSLSKDQSNLRNAAVGANGDRHDLQNSQSVAASARAVIAQGENQLRRLGAKPSTHSSSSKSKSAH